MIVWFITTAATCLGSLQEVHPTILLKAFNVAVFNGPDMSVSPMGVRRTLDKYLSLLDV